MRRKIKEKLEAWRVSENRKPLVLRGARQVGKTWLLKDFGATSFKHVVYFSFDREDAPFVAFENKDPRRIVEQLSLLSGKTIRPGETLLILDEIQACPNALGALKYFCEEMPELHVAAAGSLLGTILAKPTAYPVGKVRILPVYPMDFEEFLAAVDSQLYRVYSAPLSQVEENLPLFHQRLIDRYRQYLLVGGMPEAVQCWVRTGSLDEVRQIQDDLIAFYEGDFGKYLSGIHAARTLLVFHNIVSQLAKENEKFVYSALKDGGRAREFEVAIEWAVSAGLFVRVFNVSKPETPHVAYERLNSFKLFFFDTGLLSRMAYVSAEQLLNETPFQFKGPLTENYILQQLSPQVDAPLHYYSINDRHEIDFLLQWKDQTIPIEVKGGRKVSANSFKNYMRNNSPRCAIRFSELPLERRESFLSIPLYLAPRLRELL